MYDVIIIGGGAAGLMAALELCRKGKNVMMLEAAPQTGGRIRTLHQQPFDQPVELGAEFIHGDLALTQDLCKQAGLKYKKAGNEFWRKEGKEFTKEGGQIENEEALDKAFAELTTDMPVQQFLNQFFQDDLATQEGIKGYIEGYYAGDISKASSLFFKEEWQKSGEIQYRITGGYGTLIDYLKNEAVTCGAKIKTNTTVTEVAHTPDAVTVYAGTDTYSSRRLVVTASAGAMQQQTIAFTPALTNITNAYRQLGFGGAIKIVLQFREAFWLQKKNGDKHFQKLAFLFTEEEISTWWTQYPEKSNMLTGWITADQAARKKSLTDDALVSLAIQSLSHIFTINTGELKKNCVGAAVKNWCADPFVLGGYSYETVTSKTARAALLQGVNNTIFFAGEALHEGIDLGTVEAALQSGKAVANRLLSAEVV